MFLRDWWQRRQVRCMLVRRACEVAKSVFASTYPNETVAGLRVRAVESDRVVIAVVTKPAHPFRGMPPYRLVAVKNDLSACEELPRDNGSPYVLRGIK
jgi:hypothetical protein